MNFKSKLVLALLATSSAAFAQTEPAAAAPEVTYNVGVVSQYRYRGIAQTTGDAALQGGADYANANGFYAGAWGSTIKWIKDAAYDGTGVQAKSPVELDMYAGYKFEAAGLGYDVGYLRYEYIGNTYKDAAPLANVNANTDEAYGAGWNGSMEVPTKHALYDKIETLGGGSGITRTVVTTSGSLTLGATASVDYTYYVAAAHTLSMPSPNTNRYTIKNIHSAAITVDTAGAENIEGAANISLEPNDSVDIMSDGTNWYVH